MHILDTQNCGENLVDLIGVTRKAITSCEYDFARAVRLRT